MLCKRGGSRSLKLGVPYYLQHFTIKKNTDFQIFRFVSLVSCKTCKAVNVYASCDVYNGYKCGLYGFARFLVSWTTSCGCNVASSREIGQDKPCHDNKNGSSQCFSYAEDDCWRQGWRKFRSRL